MAELTQVLRHLIPVEDPNALVDASTGDDAAVYRLSDDRALVVTADFFTPIVDSPFDFGRIAATNALSDIYAMGGRPLFALNLVGFPRKMLGDGILEEILRGGGEVCREAGIAVLGGHTIDDPEPKFGLVGIGEVHPDRMITNAGACVGDVLVLTKPLGSGIIATAIKAGSADEATMRSAIDVMAALNKAAAEVAVAHGVRAGTDVTGYGLLGHLRSMMLASGARAEIRASDVPVLPGALELVAAGHIPGGTARNLVDVMEDVLWEADVSEGMRTILGDAQTSGGLLLCVPEAKAEQLVADLRGRTSTTAVIGQVVEGTPGTITVL